MEAAGGADGPGALCADVAAKRVEVGAWGDEKTLGGGGGVGF